MEFMGLDAFAALQRAEEINVLARCNAVAARYGLALTQADMAALTRARAETLRQTGRVEFGESVLYKLVYAFCDSPYILREDYVETLLALQEAFYYYKGEAMERMTDDELIAVMKAVFDGRAQGDLAYLAGTTLETLCRAARAGADVRMWADSDPDAEA